MAIQEFGPLTKFPGLTNSQVVKLEELTAGLSGMEKIQRQRSLYEQVLEKKGETDYLNQRNNLINGLLFKANKEKYPEERNRLQNQARIENLADIIKEKYQLPYDTKSDDIMERVIQDTQNKGVSVDSFQNYLNKGDENYLYEMGYKERGFWGKLGHNLAGGLQSMREGAKGLSGKAISGLAGYDMNAFNNYLQSKYGKSVLSLDSAILDKEEEYIKANPDFLKEYGTSVSQDVLNYGEGLLDATFSAGAPILKGGMSIFGATEAGETLLKPVAKLFGGVGNIVNNIPVLKQFKESLPEKDQERFDTFIGNVAGGLLLGTKNKGNIVKNPKQFILENLNPTEIARNFQENVLMMPKKGLKALDENLSKNSYSQNKELFIKGVKPTVKGKQNITDYNNFVDDGLKGIVSIIKNKDNLNFVNEIGEEVRGSLPKNLSEFSDAIKQTKKKIYDEYTQITKEAGGEGAIVDTVHILEELDKLRNSKSLNIANRGIKKVIDDLGNSIKEYGTLSVQEAQDTIQNLNNNLKAFYKNGNMNDVGTSMVEALVANKIRKALDESIENTLGKSEEYAELKKQYGQLRSIEEEVAKRALVDQRKNPKGLVDFSDLYSADQIIESFASGSPIGLVKGGVAGLLKEQYKRLNDPNRMIKKLFDQVEKDVGKYGELKKKGNRRTDTKDWINEKLGRKTGKKENNEYTTAEKSSSITSPGNIRAGLKDPVSETPVTTTFSFSQRDITIGGKNYHHKINDSSFKTKHIFNQQGINKQYVDNFNNAIKNGEKYALIGNYDSKDVKLYFNKNFGDHFVKHGGFAPENLVETINNYDVVSIGNKGRYIFEKQLPNGKRLRAITTKNFSEITFFETKNKFKGGEVIEQGSFKQLRDGAETKYQVVEGNQKYGVANASEKSLSSERATQLQNIRNGKTVEQLAKDYGIDVKIVDKITTPEGLRAYGKYRDGVITLADQIKESTAPHELFHGVFDIVDSGKKESILEGVMKEKKLDKVQAEEYLADSFSEYFRTGRMKGEKVIGNVGKPLGKRLYDAVKNFFQQVKDWITGVSKNKNQVKKLFDEMLDGEIDRDMLGESLGYKKDSSPLFHTKGVGEKSYRSSSTTSLAGALERSNGRSITISPENANNYQKNLGDLVGYTKTNPTPEGFLERIKKSLNVDGNSSYITNKLSDGIYTLRISNHNAKAWNNKLRGHPENNTSIVIKLADTKFKRNKSVDLVEFVYTPENLTPKKMQGIIKGVQDWIDTGEYTDKNYDLTHKSIRATLEDGEVKYQLAYHGSPYEFEKFDSAHMGKGEGGQAHGWGHYVAVDKTAANNYATMRGSIVEYKGEKLEDFFSSAEGSTYSAIEKEVIRDIADNILEWFDKPDGAWDRAQMEYERAIRNGDDVSYNKAKLNTLRALDYKDFVERGGNVYEVEVPDPIKAKTPTGKNYLEEGGAIKGKAIDTIVEQLKKGLSKKKISELDELIDSWESGYDHSIEGGRMYKIIESILGSSKKASKFLESLGYDGIHYHSGRDGEVYVIFDDNKLEIKKHHKG